MHLIKTAAESKGDMQVQDGALSQFHAAAFLLEAFRVKCEQNHGFPSITSMSQWPSDFQSRPPDRTLADATQCCAGCGGASVAKAGNGLEGRRHKKNQLSISRMVPRPCES